MDIIIKRLDELIEYSSMHQPGHLAQLGEHHFDVVGVRGSSPLVSTSKYLSLTEFFIS